MPEPPFVVITTDLELRLFTLADTAAIFRLSQDPGMRAWLPDQVYRDEAQAAEVLRFLGSHYGPAANPRNAPYVLAVCLTESHELIGHVGFSACVSAFAAYDVEVGYAIGDAHRGRGYATQAVRAASEWALARFDLPSVHGIVAEDNVASCRVLERCGFELVTAIRRRLHGVERTVRIYRFSDSTL